MPALTRTRVIDRPQTWHIHCAGVQVGPIVEPCGAPLSSDQWQWYCGFYLGTKPGDDRRGLAPTFEPARAAFEAAWQPFLAKRTARPTSRLGPRHSPALGNQGRDGALGWPYQPSERTRGLRVICPYAKRGLVPQYAKVPEADAWHCW
jgi:hypothetical protein